jgi:hypothetical protein
MSDTDIPSLLADFAREMAHSKGYPLPKWTSVPAGSALEKLPAPQMILGALRAIEVAPPLEDSLAWVMDYHLSPVIVGALRKRVEWDVESASPVLEQLTRMADRLDEGLITLGIPYPAPAVIASMDRSGLDKVSVADLASALVERYGALAVERSQQVAKVLLEGPPLDDIPGYTPLTKEQLEEGIARVSAYPDQSYDPTARKMLATLRSWIPGAPAWEADDWGEQARSLLESEASGREVELELLQLYPQHSGKFEWATTSARAGYGAFLGPNNLARLLKAVAALTPPHDDKEADVLAEAMVSAWESIEGAGRRSVKLGNQCLKALASRPEVLKRMLPRIAAASARKQVQAVIDAAS